MSKSSTPQKAQQSSEAALSPEVIQLIDHIAAILAEEFAKAMKEREPTNASSDLR